MTPFFGKRCFGKKTIFMVLSENTAFQQQNMYVEQNRKCMKNSGLFLNMAKLCFLFF